MEAWLAQFAHGVSLTLSAIAIVVVVIGAVEAVFAIVRSVFVRQADMDVRRAVWLDFARWLIAALTFQLGADIVETTVAPTWNDIGRVGAIAAIRTMLTYFLDRDIDAVRERRRAREKSSEQG